MRRLRRARARASASAGRRDAAANTLNNDRELPVDPTRTSVIRTLISPLTKGRDGGEGTADAESRDSPMIRSDGKFGTIFLGQREMENSERSLELAPNRFSEFSREKFGDAEVD